MRLNQSTESFAEELTTTEARLLAALRANAGRTLSRDELVRAAGLRPRDPLSRCVDTAVSRLRRRLAAKGLDVPLHAEHGDGYRWGAPDDVPAGAAPGLRFVVGDTVVDLGRRALVAHGVHSRLTSSEARVLARLFAKNGTPVAAVDLLARAASVAKVVCALRRKLGGVGIVSLRHEGYLLEARPLTADRFVVLARELAAAASTALGLTDVVVYRREGSVLEQVAAHGHKRGPSGEVLSPLRLPLGTGIVGWVAQSSTAARVHDTRHDRRYVLDGDEARSELSVPVTVNGSVVGVLDSEAERPGAFRASQLTGLNALAGLFAAALTA